MFYSSMKCTVHTAQCMKQSRNIGYLHVFMITRQMSVIFCFQCCGVEIRWTWLDRQVESFCKGSWPPYQTWRPEHRY